MREITRLILGTAAFVHLIRQAATRPPASRALTGRSQRGGRSAGRAPAIARISGKPGLAGHAVQR
jgi:hypothetical protein